MTSRRMPRLYISFYYIPVSTLHIKARGNCDYTLAEQHKIVNIGSAEELPSAANVN